MFTAGPCFFAQGNTGSAGVPATGPTGQTTLDVAYLGQPFISVAAGSPVDPAYMGQPIHTEAL